jgi:hypothetical protein
LVIELDFPASEGHIVAISGDLPERYVTSATLEVESVEDDRIIVVGNSDETVRVTLDAGRELTAESRAALDPLVLPVEYDFAIEQPNVLVINDWKMFMVEDVEDERAWSSSDFDDNAWLNVTSGAWEMQLPQERYDPTYPVTLWYRTSFDIQTMPASGTCLMIDGFAGSGYRLWINDREVTDRGERSYLDAEIREVDVQGFLQEGRNVVVVRLVATRKTDGMLDLLKFIGEFGVEDVDGRPGITARPTRLEVGDWTGAGYPYFSGTGIYSADIEVPEAYLDGGRLVLEADLGEDVLEVRLNGGEPLVAPWNPYRLDVTGAPASGIESDRAARDEHTSEHSRGREPGFRPVRSPPHHTRASLRAAVLNALTDAWQNQRQSNETLRSGGPRQRPRQRSGGGSRKRQYGHGRSMRPFSSSR